MTTAHGDDDDYDTDTISLTSTVPSEQGDGFYNVENLRAEGEAEDGKRVYLVEWVDYPLHRCTWEPSENLEGTSFLDMWNRRREQWVSNKRGEDFEQYIQRNIDEFEAAEREAERQKTQRQRKRAKKRRKLRSKVHDSNSEGDRPLIATRRLPPPKRTLREDTEDVSPIFVTQHQRPRKPPIDQSDDSSSPEGDDRNTLHQSKQGAERRSPKKRLESDDARRARQHQARFSKSAVGAEFVKPKNPSTTTQRAKTKKNARGPPTDASAVTASRKTSITSAQIPSPRIKTATLNTVTKPVSSAKAPPMPTATVGASPGPPVSKAVTSIKRTTTLRPIRIINQAPTNQRKEWQNSEGHYKKLTMRAKAAKRGRNEQKPDESVLQFVNWQPRWPPPVAASKSEARPADDVYGRRETRHVRRNSDDDYSTKNKQEILQDRLANKIPLTCFEWLNGSCERTAEQCRFHHTRGYRPSPYNGTVPGKYRTPPQTCIPWMENPKGCNKSEEECGFAHYNTGHLAQTGGRNVEMDINRKPKFLSNKPAAPFTPRSMLTCYFWLHSNCRSSAEECTFAHWDTGEYARAPGALEKETRTKRPQKRKSISDASPLARTLDEGYQPPVELSRFKAAPNAGNDHSRAAPPVPIHTSAQQPRESESDYNHLSPVDEPTAPQALMIVLPTPTYMQAPTRINCAEMKNFIESACELDFEKLFRQNDKNDGYLDRRAFLMFHPKDHMEEFDLITRWLMMHHVEVCSLWLDGSWDYFLQSVMGGGTGVVLVHPDFADFQDVPNFGQILRSKVRIWSIEYQIGDDDSPKSAEPIPSRYICTEIFPHGGVIVITDNVFNEKSIEASQIISLFVNKVKACGWVPDSVDSHEPNDEGFLLWRIATSPDFMKRTFEWCDAHPEAIDANLPTAQARANVYTLLSNCEYIDQDVPNDFACHPEDYWPIMSERGDIWPEYYEAVHRSQAEANYLLARHYYQWILSFWREYREVVVVHTEPQAVSWQQDFQLIAEVISPEQCIKYLQQPARGNRFEGYEWAFESKDDGSEEGEVMDIE